MKGNKSKPTPDADRKKEAERAKPQFQPSNEISFKGFWQNYSATTSQRTKIVDLFMLYLLVLIGLQFFYRLVVGDDFPRNAFISGLFCPLGVLVLLAILRTQPLNFKVFG